MEKQRMEQSGKPELVGRTLAHYEIRSAIGAGGMGEVFRATDTRLGRDVALKVLPGAMAADPERFARFQREARSVAALNHPNVVTLFSVEHSDGVHFITMELIEGHTLDRLIVPEGLPAERIVQVAGEIAEALAAAHDKGIVHRDLKPANVMVTNDGRVKVLDFGLAKDVETSSPETDVTRTSPGLTQAGMVMGTPSYMSPEQVSGRVLDHRSDIYSLGVVLYEMATGRRPFDARSSAELISSILRDTPPPVTDARPELPADLARVIRRCLEKDPRHRMQTARDVSNEFRDLARSVAHAAVTPRSTAAMPPPTVSSSVAVKPSSGTARVEDGFWVAVLPFKSSGANEDLKALAEGLTDEIITGLSRFSYLRVIARGSTARYAGQSVDVRTAGTELGARYVMEGALRQAGNKFRLAVQLVDTLTGAHLWAENYERSFSSGADFELQDDLVPRIVSTVADMNGVLPRSMSDGLRGRPAVELTPYEAVLRSFAYCYSATPEELTAARSGVEQATRKSPNYADAWAMLSFLCGQDYVHGYELQSNALEIAAFAARRAVALGPSNHLAFFSLASVLWYQKDFDSFRDAVERAVALNPMDGNSVAYLGELLTYAGGAERGMQLAERAKQLNPNHPGWYWFADFYNAFSQGDYRGALSFGLKAKMQGNPLAPMFVAAAYGQLGDDEAGARAVDELVKFRPELPGIMRKQTEKVWNAEYAERFLEGLRKAGIEIPAKPGGTLTSGAVRSEAKTGSGATRADEGFWVAVLPFKSAGGNADLKVLAEGLTEEVVTGLSRFSYLRVIARGSTAKYSNEAGDVRAIGKELGARYVMEASLRLAGSKLRVAVQLADTVTGAHLWAETYERVFTPESVFELQDDLVPRIVSTVADQYGVLTRSISETLRSKNEDTLTPHEAVLRGFSYFARLTADEHATVRRILERVVGEHPDQADCWAMLAMMYTVEYSDDYNPLPNPIERAQHAAQRAVDLAPSHAIGHYALAWTHFFRRDKASLQAAIEQALALNPMDGYAMGMLGLLLHHAGERERGIEMTEAAIKLNPNTSGALRFTSFSHFYLQGKYKEALDAAVRINMPGFFYAQAALAEALGQLGEREAAEKAVKNLLALRPDFVKFARRDYAKWYEPEDVEHLFEGLRKAGLDIPKQDEAPGSGSSRIPVKTPSGATRAQEGFWVAVLPFKHAGASAELKALAEGLTEEVVTGLSRFSSLRVIARGSTAKYSSETADVREIGKQLSTRYVLEGSLRQAGAKLRVTVQVADTVSGTQLWAETYERPFTPETLFEIQDDLVPRIVATVADQNGVLTRSMGELVRNKSAETLTPHEAVMRTFSFFSRMSPEEHAAIRDILERIVREYPDHADSWAALALIYRAEYAQGYNSRPDPLARALDAAQRAVNLAPAQAMGHYALASVKYFDKDKVGFRVEAEKALALNPMDASAKALLGLLYSSSGDWDRGVKMVKSAIHMNPNCPGYFYIAGCCDAYRRGKYEEAIEDAIRMNMPDYFHVPAMLAASFGQLGRIEEAKQAVTNLLALRPDFASIARREYRKWYRPEEAEHVLDGLRKAGLEIPDEPGAGDRRQAETSSPEAGESRPSSGKGSGAARTDEGFWVAVLPFKHNGRRADVEALADGLSDDVITGLNRFSFLRVIARSSTARYANENVDVRAAAKELGARYVLEGSLHHAGAKVRIATRLVDAASGAGLWAETYDRTFKPEAMLDLLDDVVPRIVSTVGDTQGILVHNMTEILRHRDPNALTPYEAVIRSFAYLLHVSESDHRDSLIALERAVKTAPVSADAWAMLSWLYRGEFMYGFNARPDPLDRAFSAAQRALSTDPNNMIAHAALASIYFSRRDLPAFRASVHRAIAVNRTEAYAIGYLGLLLAYSGEWDEGCALAERAAQLHTSHPGWYWAPLALNAYRQGEGKRALEFALRINMPGVWSMYLVLTVIYVQIGDTRKGRAAANDMLAARPKFSADPRAELSAWFQPEMVEQMMGDLKKLGIE